MQKQQLTDKDFGPNADAAKLTGNKSAQAMAEKARAVLTETEANALLLAQRNAALDNAIERLGEHGENWVSGHLCLTDVEEDGEFWERPLEDQLDPYGSITVEFAKLMREKGKKFCLIGAIGAEYGPYSFEAIEAAIAAISDVLTISGRKVYGEGYGFRHGGIFVLNDSHGDGELIVEAFRQAKSQPLRKS